MAKPVAASPLTILNVNDDEATRYVVTRILQRNGYLVEEAKTGEEALRFVQAAPDKASLVVLDVNLPDINGIEVCRRIKEDPATASLPVLHLSATSVGTEDRAKGLESGADGYLIQPVEPPVLTATIKALLRLSLAESRARDAAQSWEAVFAAIGDGVCLVNVGGKITRCNPAMVHLLNKPETYLKGHSWETAMNEAFPDTDFSYNNNDSLEKRIVREIRTGPPEKLGRWLRVSIEALKPAMGKSSESDGTVHIVSDITESKEAVLRQRVLLRDILASVTEGSLHLCLSPADLPIPLAAVGEPVGLIHQTVRKLRFLVRKASTALGFSDEREQNLETAVGEAAMNAVVHAKKDAPAGTVKGSGSVCSDGKNTVQVWIQDAGGGIAIESLHLATLQRGYTTANTLGHGFWMILHTCDRVWLLTGDTGTTVVLEQDREPTAPAWERHAHA